MSNSEEIEVEEPVETLLLQWYMDTAALQDVAYRVHELAARLSATCATHLANEIPDAVERFLALAATARREAFESLFFATVRLHNRGVEVLHPDRGPVPVPSPFVRQMPGDQAEVEEKRSQRLVRHMDAYESHIIRSLEHFEETWSALLYGVLGGDLEMTDDEFPKLAVLSTEVQKAYEIWSSVA